MPPYWQLQPQQQPRRHNAQPQPKRAHNAAGRRTQGAHIVHSTTRKALNVQHLQKPVSPASYYPARITNFATYTAVNTMQTVKRIPDKDSRKITFFDAAAVGVFDVKGWRKSYGILYPLSSHDAEYTTAVKLKGGEKLYRYETTTTKAGNLRPLIKVNTYTGNVYFLTPEAAAADVLQFESRGTKAQFINLLESQF